MLSIVFILALFSYTNLFSQNVDEINWIPPEPVEGDEVTVVLSGWFPRANWRNQDIQVQGNGNNLILTFTSLEEGMGADVMTPFTIRVNLGELEAGEYNLRVEQAIAIVNEDGMLEIRDVVVYFSEIIVEGEEPDQFVVVLTEGWNMSSSPVDPEDNDIRAVFSELVERGSLLLAKDGSGRFYYPVQNFLNIPRWDVHQGYLIKVNEEEELLVSGELVSEDDQIELNAGWSMVAYLPEAAIPAPEAFENIEGNLLLAKDGYGRFYSPEHNFSNMGELQQGKGYLVKLEDPDNLIWNQP